MHVLHVSQCLDLGGLTISQSVQKLSKFSNYNNNCINYLSLFLWIFTLPGSVLTKIRRITTIRKSDPIANNQNPKVFSTNGNTNRKVSAWEIIYKQVNTQNSFAKDLGRLNYCFIDLHSSIKLCSWSILIIVLKELSFAISRGVFPD